VAKFSTAWDKFPVEAGLFIYATTSRQVMGPTHFLSGKYRGLFPQGKVTGAWSWLSPSYSVEVNTTWSLTCYLSIHLHTV